MAVTGSVLASRRICASADEKIVQRALQHAKAHVTKVRYIKAFDRTVLAAMKKIDITLDAMKLVHQLCTK